MEAEQPFSGVWQILVVRNKLRGGNLMSQMIHACRDSAVQWALTECEEGAGESYDNLRGMPPEDTRNVILLATKAQMAALVEGLTAAGIPHRTNTEVSGDFANVMTSVGIVTTEKEKVDPLISHLRRAKFYEVDLERQELEADAEKEKKTEAE